MSRAAGWLALSLLLATAARVEAQGDLALRSTAAPSTAKLGEQVIYRGRVTGGPAGRYRWIAPDRLDAITWGAPVMTVLGPRAVPRPLGRNGTLDRNGGVADTLLVELPLQVFTLGKLTVPGMRLEITQATGKRVVSLPPVEVTVIPTLDPADTAATLEPLRTLAAPWWERVPWLWVAAGLALLALVVWLWRRLRRRRPADAAAPAPAPRRDPATEALEALARLRAMGLPARGRFAEHAFILGQILRRYLEATVITTRPGDSTPELIAHLREARLEAADLQRLSGLLRVWDRVKFARAAFTAEEASATEAAVEGILRRPPGAAPAERVA